MNPRLGAALPIRSTLGTYQRSNARPGIGNGFSQRFREDLALFAELGVTDLRLGVDWSRLQPRPNEIDDDWREWYQDVLAAARNCGITVWSGLLEQAVPTWFADDGGFGDAKNAGRWWPRWVEQCTEMFGELTGGWYPIHDPIGLAADGPEDGSPRHLDALTNLLVAWRDAWRILRGGPPVATSLGVRIVRPVDESPVARETARRDDHLRWTLWLRALRDGTLSVPTRMERTIGDLAGSLDVLGIALAPDLLGLDAVNDDTVGPWEDRAGELLRRAAEEGPERPIHVTFRARRSDDDERRVVVDALGRALAGARRDGLAIATVFWSPGIDGPGDTTGPINREREPKPSARSWDALATPVPD